jgi:tRNA(Ile2) C34 agmatinyltransferase TiaS
MTAPVCPFCGHVEHDSIPHGANGYVCFDCGALSMLTTDMALRRATAAEAVLMPQDAMALQFKVRARGRLKSDEHKPI